MQRITTRKLHACKALKNYPADTCNLSSSNFFYKYIDSYKKKNICTNSNLYDFKIYIKTVVYIHVVNISHTMFQEKSEYFIMNKKKTELNKNIF